MVDEENNLIFIGVVGNAKGLKGNVQINYFSKDLEKFKSYEYFYLGEKKEKHKVQKHFISGALYFSARPNYDSIFPAIDYIKNDIVRIMESLQWKN